MGKHQEQGQHDRQHALPRGWLGEPRGKPAGNDRRRGQQCHTLEQAVAILTFPVTEYPRHHQQDQYQRQWHKEPVEVRTANGDFQVHGLEEQRGHGAHQHHKGSSEENQIVAQQEGFPGHRLETLVVGQGGGTKRKQGQCAASHHAQESQNKGAPLRIIGEGMHRGQHPGTNQEGTQQAQ